MLCRIKGINSYPSLYVFKTGMVSDKTSSAFRKTEIWKSISLILVQLQIFSIKIFLVIYYFLLINYFFSSFALVKLIQKVNFKNRYLVYTVLFLNHFTVQHITSDLGRYCRQWCCSNVTSLLEQFLLQYCNGLFKYKEQSVVLSLKNITMYLKKLGNSFHKISSMLTALCTSRFIAACQVVVPGWCTNCT